MCATRGIVMLLLLQGMLCALAYVRLG